jgi:hypothetical protein
VGSHCLFNRKITPLLKLLESNANGFSFVTLIKQGTPYLSQSYRHFSLV